MARFSMSLLFLLFTACQKGDNAKCVGFRQAAPVQVDGPASVKINEGEQINIKIIARHSGCVCPLNMPLLDAVYRFKSGSVGIYYLKFESPDKPVYDTIEVKE